MLAMTSDDRDFLSVLGHCFLQYGKFEQARTVFEAMAILFPGNLTVMASLAYALLRLGEYERALAEADTFLETAASDRDRGFGLLLRARALTALARTEEAKIATEHLRSITHDH